MLFWCHDELHFISCHSQYDRIEFQMQQSMYCILSSSTATHFEETFDSYLSSKLLVSLMLPTQLCVMLLALLGGAGIILCCLNVSWCWTFTTIFEFKYSNTYQNHIIAFYWKISYDIFLSAFRLSIDRSFCVSPGYFFKCNCGKIYIYVLSVVISIHTGVWCFAFCPVWIQ